MLNKSYPEFSKSLYNSSNFSSNSSGIYKLIVSASQIDKFNFYLVEG